MFRDILVADSNIGSRDKFLKVLSSMGYKVGFVPNGNEVIVHLQTKRPYLLILDQELLPDGGLKTLERVRMFEKELRVVFLTKNEPDVDTEVCREARKLGVTEILKKGFSNYTMFKRILGMLEDAPDMSADDKYLSLGRILVVDDCPEMRTTLETFLNRKGFHVKAAADGENALAEIRAQKTKIVICDERMPGMDGLMVLRKIKEYDKSINVVMLTAVGDEDVVKEATALGACGFLTKPCDLQEIEKLILSLLIRGI
ncbi:MAG: response regulator [Candidatus Omnitrophica bacterium]|nr:response regulator [Candidatus Omnitrophota bacterium]